MPAGFRLQTRASPGRGQAGKAPGLVLTHVLQVKQNLQRQHRARQQRRDWRQDRAPPSAPRGRPSPLRLRPSCFRFIWSLLVTSGRFPLVPLPPRRFGPLAPLTGIGVPSASHTPPPSRSVHPSRSGRGDRAENSHLTTAPESCPLDQVRTPSGSGPCNRSSLPAALALIVRPPCSSCRQVGVRWAYAPHLLTPDPPALCLGARGSRRDRRLP